MQIRHLEPADYNPIVAVVDDWWGGRHMAAMLPRLFFAHFRPTSFAAEEDGRLCGFLVGFVSQTDPTQAYIHFVGVDPATHHTCDTRCRRLSTTVAVRLRGE